MSDPVHASAIVRTKLFPPPVRRGWLSRPRLLGLLADAESLPLTLVSAGAGFGKTSVVGEWVSLHEQPKAWLSLEAADDVPSRFWAYVTAALAGVVPERFEALHRAVISSSAPEPHAVLTELVNGLAEGEHRITLVLDDLHVIEDAAIHEQLTFLLEHSPPQLRTIVTTRVDPPWPLSRWRAQGRMVEIRAADLRFTSDETSALLTLALGSPLDVADCSALQARTEGWVVGLHMAALSLRATPDAHAFISAFSGSHRFVLDYLAEEVLAIQDERTRAFLLRTSILARFRAELCDAMLGTTESAAIIEELETRNLFVVPLDETRRWYRYHHLFSEYLRARLASDAIDLAALHGRASEWFEAVDLREEAIDHALDAADWDRAVRLLEVVGEERFTVQHQVRTLGWLARLPDSVISRRPALCSTRIWASFVVGNWAEARSLLEVAQRALAQTSSSMSPQEHLRTELQYGTFATGIAYEFGELEDSVGLAQAVIARAGAEHRSHANMARVLVAGTHLHLGELERTRALCAQALEIEPDPVTAQVALALAAQADLLDGHLRRVESCFAAAMRRVGDDRGPVDLAAGMTRLCMGEALRERGDLDRAEVLLRQGIEQCSHQRGLPEHVYIGRLALARTLLARGEATEAVALLESAERLRLDELSGRPGLVRLLWPALLQRARLWLELGRLDELRAWLDAGPRTPPAGSGGALQVLAARCDLLQGEQAAARARLADEPEGAYLRARIERRWLLGEHQAARELAAPEGYVRIFEEPPGGPPIEPARGAVSKPGAEPPTEDLNEREAAILRLMGAGLSNAEIASQLFLSIHTVKWHARNLYGKLGVKSRTQALARARKTGKE